MDLADRMSRLQKVTDIVPMSPDRLDSSRSHDGSVGSVRTPATCARESQMGSESRRCLKKKDPCYSCFRVAGIDDDTVVQGEKLKPLYSDGRGGWCPDCHPAWRTCASKVHSLPAFKIHLESYDNWCNWELQLMAHILLKSEEKARITQTMIDERVASLVLFCKMMGFPLRRSVLVPLREFYGVGSTTKDTPLSDVVLGTIRRNGRDELGVWTEVQAVNRNAPSCCMSPSLQIGHRRWLNVDDLGDHRVLQAMSSAGMSCLTEAVLEEDMSTGGVAQLSTDTSLAIRGHTMTKLDERVHSLIASDVELLRLSFTFYLSD